MMKKVGNITFPSFLSLYISFFVLLYCGLFFKTKSKNDAKRELNIIYNFPEFIFFLLPENKKIECSCFFVEKYTSLEKKEKNERHS